MRTPKRGLLAEDNAGDAQLTAELLDEADPGGFSRLAARTLAEAETRLGADGFDLVLKLGST